jgi:osmotically-inducible protein OsmY
LNQNQVPTVAQTNRFGLQSQFGPGTNQFGVYTNQFGLTNQVLTPTGSTNRIFTTNNPGRPLGSNIFSPTNNGGFILQDSALTPADRTLLVQARQTVSPVLAAAGSWNPVGLMVRNSVITLVGYVPSAQVRQQIEASARTTPGTLGVVNSIQVINQDVAVDASDRALLVQIRQAVQPMVASLGATPLRFIVRGGNVTLVGNVTQPELRQQIETTVTQVPGVLGIVNRSGDGAMTVNATAGATVAPAVSAVPAAASVDAVAPGSAAPAPGVTVVPPAVFPTTAAPAPATNQFGIGPGAVLPPTGRVPGAINTNLPVLPNVPNNPTPPTVPKPPTQPTPPTP